MIAKRFNMRGGDWDLLAPMCTYNYNIAVHSVTMMSSFFLKNAREARVPVALALGTIEWNNNTEPASYAQTQLEQMKVCHELAAQNIERCHEKNAAQRADKYANISFDVGQKVWLY